MLSSTLVTPYALKEWAIAIDALCRGKTILLLRKGGIREEQGRFEVQHRRVWLFPTYEHQAPDLLKPGYSVQAVESGWHPKQVTLQAWADITQIFQVTETRELDALMPFHIWNQQFATERFRWKPKQPLYGLLLRTYRLEAPITLAYQPEFGGCKSWLDVGQHIPQAQAQHATPVLSDAAYAAEGEAIATALLDA